MNRININDFFFVGNIVSPYHQNSRTGIFSHIMCEDVDPALKKYWICSIVELDLRSDKVELKIAKYILRELELGQWNIHLYLVVFAMSTIGHTSVQLLHWRVYDPVTSLMLHSMTCRAPVSKKKNTEAFYKFYYI